MEQERIQKLLSQAGICSRRKAEEYLLQGRIKVNGIVVTELGFKCSFDDEILLDDKPINKKEENKYIYLAFNKPYDVVSTLSDPQGRRTIVDYIPKKYGRLLPVGRLDINSTGLMILTNDGEFVNLITHPSSEIEKEYLVRVKNPLKGDEIEKLEEGIYILQDAYKALPCKAKVLKEYENEVLFSIILKEGKKREIRHMMESLSHPVRMLTRIRIGNILLGDLKEGETREIDISEIVKLKESSKRK